MSGVPLVLPIPGCAREYFDGWADYVRPDDLPGIRQKVLGALERNRIPSLAKLVQRRYSWTAAADATREAYEKVI
jgi:glycosyltransferase involved in cell wall biosynthesis